jgi:diguanylate cyclase (GGDEF)-like protein
LAMIDLDFFKHINDSYGHPSGDQVIRVLSRLLQQRLRRGDIIGRYGGEEFVVIMPGTTATVAIGVLDKVRETFSKIRHHADEHEFTVTFSAGVADMTTRQDADALIRAADAALYRAKGNGRNRIEPK